jgi:hydroxymethylglutaryl-CoA lyase
MITLKSLAELAGYKLPTAVDIREVGPRDGLQLEEPLSLEQKIEFIDALARTGVRRIEVTSFVSPTAVPALADAHDLVQELHQWPHIEFCALVAGYGGAKRALAAGITHLQYVISASDGHAQANAGKTVQESVEAGRAIIDLVHRSNGICEVIIATAFDCPFDGPTEPAQVAGVLSQLVAAGADRITLADTIGTATPDRVLDLLQTIRPLCPELAVGLHLHNTRDTAMANVLAALLLGVTDFDAAVGGLGGCPFAPGASGNLATEDLVNFLEDMGISTGIDLDAAGEAGSLVAGFLDRPLNSALSKCSPRIGFTYATDRNPTLAGI